MKRFKKYTPIIESVSGAIMALSALAAGVWYPSKFNVRVSEIKEGEIFNQTKFLFSLVLENILVFTTPVPYLLISVGAVIFCSVVKYKDISKFGYIEEIYRDKIEAEESLRVEKDKHGDTKSTFYAAIHDALKHILTDSSSGFCEGCRVTIYRKSSVDDDFLVRIFRFSHNHEYLHSGRLKVSVNEGVVGAAWKNHGMKQFSSSKSPGHRSFKKALRESLAIENCVVPSGSRTMPTRHYHARAIFDAENGNKVGIVVYEATSLGKLKAEAIDERLLNATLDVARLVRIRGLLHSEFNPDPVGAK